MIITTIIKLWCNAMIGIVELLPQLPSLPTTLTDYIEPATELIFQMGNLIAFFLPPMGITIILLELSIALEAFCMLYWVVMWIVKKIPVMNIK